MAMNEILQFTDYAMLHSDQEIIWELPSICPNKTSNFSLKFLVSSISQRQPALEFQCGHYKLISTTLVDSKRIK